MSGNSSPTDGIVTPTNGIVTTPIIIRTDNIEQGARSNGETGEGVDASTTAYDPEDGTQNMDHSNGMGSVCVYDLIDNISFHIFTCIKIVASIVLRIVSFSVVGQWVAVF